MNNNLYELVSIANSIIDSESNLGDANERFYMDIYPDLKVEKFNQVDGSTIYIVTDRNREGTVSNLHQEALHCQQVMHVIMWQQTKKC